MPPTSSQYPYDLPATAPDMLNGDVQNTETLPLALYTLDTTFLPSDLVNLASHLEQDYVIDLPSDDQMHLIRPAPNPLLTQSTLESTLDSHIRYANSNKAQLGYFPFAFLVAHDRDWEGKGLWVVHVDFEGEKRVTGFRVKGEDLGGVCRSLRDDDEGVEVLKEEYGLGDERAKGNGNGEDES